MATVVIPPRRNRVVDVLDRGHTPHEECEDPERETADDRDGDGNRQQQTGDDGTVDPAQDESSQSRVLVYRQANRPRRLLGRSLGLRARLRVPECGKERDQPCNERRGDVSKKRHG